MKEITTGRHYNLDWAQAKGEILVEATKAYKAEELRDIVVQEPLEVKISEGKKLYDITHFQDPFNFAISDKMKEVLEANNLKGWRTFPVSIIGRQEKYHGFQVMGRCGAIDKSGGPGFVVGYKFDETTWDGADFFSPEGTFLVFLSEKAKNALEASQITNVSFRDISTIKHYCF